MALYVAIFTDSWGTRGYGTENVLLINWKLRDVAEHDKNAVQPLLKSVSTGPGYSVAKAASLALFDR